MCGICGIVSLLTRDVESEGNFDDQVLAMLTRMIHRGPQGPTATRSGAGAFGAQRLAIRGLDDGAQPLLDPESGVLAVCNGEIDNHLALRDWLAKRGRHVRQSTDIAILPALYLELGEPFVEKLEGVFAIALWSPREQKLVLARDRAGERSLFYRVDDAVVRFATEVAALVAASPHELKIDRPAIAGYLRNGCFVAPGSPICGISKVGPGEIVTLCGNNVTRRRYWRWPVMQTPKTKPSTTTFDDIFRAAVRSQTRVDVPYGFFLSGGLDSSIVVAVAKAVRPDHHPPCFTLRFSEGSYDEGPYAERVARHLGLDIVSVPIGPEAFIEELPRLVRRVGEPLADPAWLPTALLSQRAARDARIVFTGEGGDELFGGYPTYLGAGYARKFERLPEFVRAGVTAVLRALPASDKKIPVSYLLKRFVAGAGMNSYARHQLWTATIPPDLLARLGVRALKLPDEPNLELEQELGRIQLHDLETTLAEGLLTKSDRGGMSASIELRAPFLDRTVMEFAATLPASERIHGVTTKHFLKCYAARYLPRNIVHRRKRGLSVPLAIWLRGPLRTWAEEKLQEGRLADVGVHQEIARTLLREHVQKQADHSRSLWALLVLDEWLTWVHEQSVRHLQKNVGLQPNSSCGVVDSLDREGKERLTAAY